LVVWALVVSVIEPAAAIPRAEMVNATNPCENQPRRSEAGSFGLSV
jgi:hypothetical protein